MKYIVITKDGSKWLRPVNPHEKHLVDEFGLFRNPDHVTYELQSRDTPYIGTRPEGTVLDESEVTAITQARHKESSSLTWFNVYDNGNWDYYETRIAYTDAESHDLYVFDEILNNTSDDAKMNVSLQMDLNYWKRRCEAAENYINESPCDPDITKTQNAAYEAWQEIVKQQPK